MPHLTLRLYRTDLTAARKFASSIGLDFDITVARSTTALEAHPGLTPLYDLTFWFFSTDDKSKFLQDRRWWTQYVIFA